MPLNIRQMMSGFEVDKKVGPDKDQINSPITEFYHAVQLHVHPDPGSGGVRFEREPKVHVDTKKEAKETMDKVRKYSKGS